MKLKLKQLKLTIKTTNPRSYSYKKLRSRESNWNISRKQTAKVEMEKNPVGKTLNSVTKAGKDLFSLPFPWGLSNIEKKRKEKRTKLPILKAYKNYEKYVKTERTKRRGWWWALIGGYGVCGYCNLRKVVRFIIITQSIFST